MERQFKSMFIFDFDGVIADTLQGYAQVCRQIAIKLGYQKTLPENPFADLDPVTFEAMGKKLGVDADLFAAETALAMRSYSDIPDLFPDIPEVLAELSQKLPIGILSAGNSQVLIKVLAYHQVDDYFEFIIGGDTPGSKADKLKILRQQYNRPLTMIGDSISDIDAAKQAGIPSIAVTWGWQSASLLKTRNPDHMIYKPRQLLALADSMKN